MIGVVAVVDAVRGGRDQHPLPEPAPIGLPPGMHHHLVDVVADGEGQKILESGSRKINGQMRKKESTSSIIGLFLCDVNRVSSVAVW